MTRAEFLAYLDDLTGGDPARLAGHFTPDVVFENFGHRQQGGEVVAFLTALAALVETRIAPRHILIDGDTVAMEADMTVTAIVDAPALRIGPMRRGERVVSRLFAFYDTRGDRICHARLAGWPPA